MRERTPEQQKFLQEVKQYELMQQIRIGIQNRLSAAVRRGIITEEESDEYSTPYVKDLIRIERVVIFGNVKDGKAGAKRFLADMRVWEEWFSHVRGIGPVNACRLLAYVQPVADFPTVSMLYGYTGYGSFKEDGSAEKRERGKKISWIPELKTTLRMMAESFEKQGGFYRNLYDHYKARQHELHPEKVAKVGKDGKPIRSKAGDLIYDFTDGHLRSRALRYAAKRLLADLWQVWREFEGLPVRAPFPIEHLGHTTVYSPWDVIEYDKKFAEDRLKQDVDEERKYPEEKEDEEEAA